MNTTIDATKEAAERYYAFYINGPGWLMPCGEIMNFVGKDQKCPNSGNCKAGHKECWFEKYAVIERAE